MKVLYTSSDVRREVRRLFDSGTKRRIAIVAYVGKDATAYLKRPAGIRLYCSDSLGTNPDEVERLRDEFGVRCYFASNVHMKVYFAEGVGCVITSANLSTRALDGGTLREAGVLLSEKAVDIDRFLRDLNPQPVTNQRLDALRAKVERTKGKWSGGTRGRTFADWYAGSKASHGSESWKFCPFETWRVSVGNAAQAKAGREYRVREPLGEIQCSRHDVLPESFLLTARATPAGRLTDWDWMHVDGVYGYTKTEIEKGDHEFSHVATQWFSKKAATAPFRLDKEFRKAFAIAFSEQPRAFRKKYLNPDIARPLPAAFLARVAKRYRELGK